MSTSLNTIPFQLQHWAKTEPDTPAFIFVDVNWQRNVLLRTDVFRLASRYAAILRRRGINKGQVVCNTLVNSPERLISDLGIILAGAISMNGPVLLADGADLISSLRDAKCTAILVDPRRPRDAAEILTSRVHEVQGNGHVRFPELPDLQLLLECHFEKEGEGEAFLDMVERETDEYVADVSPSDVAYVQTTSGSTGFSKLVPRTHAQLLRIGHDCFYIMSNSEYSEGQNTEGKRTVDVFYSHSALGWAGGCPVLYFSNGITRVLLNFSQGEPEDRVEMGWKVACQERCTVAFLPPTYIEIIMQTPELWQNADFRFRSVLLAGRPVYKRHIQGAIGKITDAICVIYGGTEISIVACNFLTNPDEYEDCNNGKPLENTDVKIVDDTLTEVGKGEIGELCVRSCRVLTHYFSNYETTLNSFLPDGWFRTGDVGHLNGQGQLFIVCRTSFSIIRGPYIIYPGWLETRISRHPEVQQVMVVPVPDPVMHQELCACVVTRTGATVTSEDLHDFCKEMFLTKEGDPRTAIPKYFLFFDSFQVTTTGKTCRRSLMTLARHRLLIDNSMFDKVDKLNMT